MEVRADVGIVVFMKDTRPAKCLAFVVEADAVEEELVSLTSCDWEPWSHVRLKTDRSSKIWDFLADENGVVRVDHQLRGAAGVFMWDAEIIDPWNAPECEDARLHYLTNP
jgi:hypothetical protein